MTPTQRLVKDALAAMKSEPARAAALCRAVLEAEPHNGDARLLLSEALRLLGDLPAARAAVLEELKRRPDWFGVHRQLGIIAAEQGEPVAAVAAMSKAAQLSPAHPTIWRELADQLALAGDIVGAQRAYAQHALMPPADQRLVRAAQALRANNHEEARALIDPFLKEFPTDVTALRMLAEAQARADLPSEAENTLRRCLELAPALVAARHALGQLLIGLGRPAEARDEARILLQTDPRNRGSMRLMAAALNSLGEYEEAASCYRQVVEHDPKNGRSWTSLGHVLTTLGRTEEGIDAFRRGLAVAPELGQAWWSLANLKTVRFSEAEIALMKQHLADSALPSESRTDMHFALGKALEDQGDADGAFAHYSAGARLRREATPYDAMLLTRLVERSKVVLTPDFFSAREGAGHAGSDPIFILGLPRAGSTLIEQILASHSAVEGTSELPDLQNLAFSLVGNDRSRGANSYIDELAALPHDALRSMGESYLNTTRSQRKTNRPRFIDKMPGNFAHIGLLHLILPNAKIIDARRHPMACGWSCFKQHFALGSDFSYDLEDIGRYYADYVELMAHYDSVLPGRVHRVIHEQLVTDPEPHIRALLDYCGLPFEEACLRPHENKRAVATASSEQVRRPISAKGLDDWRAFEPYLTPLKRALGPVLDAYPDAPR